jgi:signal transduction histidine kinase/ActR/RegA family two-component response regulator
MVQPTPEPAGREPAGTAPAPDVTTLVAAEQLRMVFAHMTAGTVIATVFALVLAAHLQDRVPANELLVWVALKLGIAVPRIVQGQLYRLRGRPGTAGWHRWTHALLAVDGAVWGLGGAWLAGGATDLVAEVAASLCCVASVATFGLQVRLAATAAYVVPMIAPTAAALLGRGDRFGAFAGVGLVLLLGLMLITARRGEKRLAEVFALRFLTDRISEERAQALAHAHRQSAVKTQFLATMSHELRTPLHGILGLTRVLRTEHPEPALRHRLGLIERSGEHLLQLINDLLDMSRIEAGRIELQTADVDLQAELDELVDIYFVRAQEKGLAFSASIDLPRPCWVRTDPTRLRQVLHNLLGNALKFTDAGSVALSARQAASGEFVFSVQDTGHGIAPEDLPKVFNAFWQASASQTKRAAGAGLGLNIAQEMAHAMGGSIQATSELGKGSLFELVLPLGTVPAPAAALGDGGAAIVDRLTEEGGRVLLAEDNEVNALVVEAMLSRNGCQVLRAADGAEAVRLATDERGRPSIVLMDCQMPEVDGLEATRRIRAAEVEHGWPRVPVIALTANTATDDRVQCRRAGMDYFLGKPFTEQELMVALAVCLHHPAEPPQPAGPRLLV